MLRKAVHAPGPQVKAAATLDPIAHMPVRYKLASTYLVCVEKLNQVRNNRDFNVNSK